jgi:uncharacterized membrane protein YkoI
MHHSHTVCILLSEVATSPHFRHVHSGRKRRSPLLKQILLGGAAASALTAAYLVGSLSIGGAFAQTTPTASPTAAAQSQPGTQQADPAAKEAGEQNTGANDSSEGAALASQAKITADQATAAALAKFPGATVGKVELDNENGVLAYSVQLKDTAGTGQDVKVDATSGAVLSAQADAPETPGGPEAAETAD